MIQNPLYIYDIETYPNFISVTLYSVETGVFKQAVIDYWGNNDTEWLRKLFTREDITFCGYNNFGFDDGVINHIIRYNLSPLAIFTFAQELINGKNQYRYNSKFDSIDLLEIIRAGFSSKSLKGIGVNINYPRIQDLPFSVDSKLTQEQAQEVLEYNKNDVELTLAAYEQIKNKIEMREFLTSEYGIDLRSASDSTIAKKLLDKWYSEASGEPLQVFRNRRTERNNIPVRDIIYDYVNFSSEPLKQYLDGLKEKEIVCQSRNRASDKFTCDIPPVELDGVKYSLGLGGIHSEDESLVLEPEEDELLLDLDVGSQYPTAIIQNSICPEHLDPNIFPPLVKNIVDTRLYHKKRKKESERSKVLDSALKITCNSLYGFFNSKTYWLFDPKATFTTTLNNQLLLLALIESLVQADIKVLSANTDGIVVHVKKSQYNQLKAIYQAWEEKTGFALEETYYNLYVRRDINNYLSQTTDGSVKTKGIFTPQGGLLAGYRHPITAIALKEYYLNGTHPRETVESHDNIYDFCLSQKVGSQFVNNLETIEKVGKGRNADIRIIHSEEVQKTLRFYVSNPDQVDKYTCRGKRLRKRKQDSKEHKYIEYVSGKFQTLMNDYFEGDYRVDYTWYVEQVMKEIEAIGQLDAHPVLEKEQVSSEQLKLF